jgi:hypothetical protein
MACGSRHRAAAIGALAIVLAAPATARQRPTEEAIGSWSLTCPAPPATGARPDPCILRHQDWIVPQGAGGPAVALEVQARGGGLVPVVVVRGLPVQAAIGGALAARPDIALRLDNLPQTAMTCGLSGAAYACAPAAQDVPAVADALPRARSARVRVVLAVPGLGALPPQERSMDLAGTSQALARLRELGAEGESLPIEPGLDWQGFLDRLMRAAGFPNGAADLIPAVLPLVGGGKA